MLKTTRQQLSPMTRSELKVEIIETLGKFFGVQDGRLIGNIRLTFLQMDRAQFLVDVERHLQRGKDIHDLEALAEEMSWEACEVVTGILDELDE